MRLHPGREGRTPSKEDARRRLSRLWPGHQEPVSADDLEKRFGGDDLRRLARRDQHMDRLIEILGLPRAS